MKNLWIRIAFGVIAVSVWAAAAQAAGLAVAPGTITNDFVGKISFTITGLSPGQSVLLEAYADLNLNGTIDAGEPLVQGGRLTDGLLPSIDGVRNLNVPGDEDGAVNGQIRMDLQYPSGEKGLAVVAGRRLIRISDAGTGTALATGSLEIKQKVFPQGAKGRITAAASGASLANVIVVLVPQNGGPVTGAQTDSTGNFNLYCPPGNYVVVPLAPGYVADFSGGVAVVAGALATRDLVLPASTRTIAGKVKDSVTGAKLPGVFIQAQSSSGQFVGVFSLRDGGYSIGVGAGSYSVSPSSASFDQQGYVGWADAIPADTTAASVANFDLLADQATALVYGTVKDSKANPVIGIGVWAGDPSHRYNPSGTGFAPTGDYCVGVRAGDWWIAPDNEELAARGYTGRGTNLTLVANQALKVDFVLGQVTAHLAGRVVDETGAPVDGVWVSAWEQQGGESGTSTDQEGNFELGVTGGSWYLRINTDDIRQRGLVGPQLQITLGDGETRSGIVLVARRTTREITGQVRTSGGHPLEGISVYASNLIGATNYTDTVNTDASGNYRLTVFPGGWDVWPECSDLQLIGYSCLTSVHITVGGGNGALNLVVDAGSPLAVTTPSLPDGVLGGAYSSQLQASGGAQPYSWSLAPGSASLPEGLSLGADGIISGTPTALGTFYFIVRVTDNASNTAEQFYAITIPSPPLVLVTDALPVGVVGTQYNFQLEASGGDLPYLWSMALGSAALPGGITLSSAGSLSGIPTKAGTNTFILRVQDHVLRFQTRVFTLVVTPGVPKLSIALPNPGTVAIRWPAPSDGFVLEKSASLAGAIRWEAVGSTPAVSDGQKVVTLPVQTGQQFFRLRQP